MLMGQSRWMIMMERRWQGRLHTKGSHPVSSAVMSIGQPSIPTAHLLSRCQSPKSPNQLSPALFAATRLCNACRGHHQYPAPMAHPDLSARLARQGHLQKFLITLSCCRSRSYTICRRSSAQTSYSCWSSILPAASCAESEILEICLVEKVVTTSIFISAKTFVMLCVRMWSLDTFGWWIRSGASNTLVVTAKHQLTDYLYRDAAVLPAIHPDSCSAYANTHQFCPLPGNYGKPQCINVVQLIIPSLPATLHTLFPPASLFASLLL